MLNNAQSNAVLSRLLNHEIKHGIKTTGLTKQERINWAVRHLYQTGEQPTGRVFVPVDDPSPPLTSDRLIVTVATGPVHERLLASTSVFMRRYADRIGADFIALTGETQCWWGLEKFRVKPYVQAYKRTLFIDADVLIRDDAPDIFLMVPECHVGMHDDQPHLPSLEWAYQERQRLWASQGVEQWHPSYIFNTGVVVCDSMHASIWQPPTKPMPGEHCNEQFWIERNSRDYLRYRLHVQFNTQWYMKQFFKLAKYAWFIHLANCPAGDRLGLIRHFTRNGNRREIDP